VGVKEKLQLVVPVAALKVVPPFTDTSTRATTPPPVSLPIPVMLTAVPVNNSAPNWGDVTPEIGGVVSRTTVVASCVGGFWTFPLVSTARLLICTDPGVAGVKEKLQLVVPVAALKVVPPSTETSTRATDPPPVSLAVPVMLFAIPANMVDDGKLMVEVGGVVSGIGVGLGTPPPPVIPHPELIRLELTTAIPIRTHKTLT
jgi:hypothetical protein